MAKLYDVWVGAIVTANKSMGIILGLNERHPDDPRTEAYVRWVDGDAGWLFTGLESVAVHATKDQD